MYKQKKVLPSGEETPTCQLSTSQVVGQTLVAVAFIAVYSAVVTLVHVSIPSRQEGNWDLYAHGVTALPSVLVATLLICAYTCRIPILRATETIICAKWLWD